MFWKRDPIPPLFTRENSPTLPAFQIHEFNRLWRRHAKLHGLIPGTPDYEERAARNLKALNPPDKPDPNKAPKPYRY